MCVLPQKLKERRRDFPGSPVVKTLHLQGGGCGCGGVGGGAGSIPGQETKIPTCLKAQSRKEKKKEIEKIM